MEEAIALEGPSLAAVCRFKLDLRFSLLIEPPKIATTKPNKHYLFPMPNATWRPAGRYDDGIVPEGERMIISIERQRYNL